MDNVLKNDLALLFQLVSDKEKKENKDIRYLTRVITDTFLKVSGKKTNNGKPKHEKQ
jgi:hypothetical protein